MLKLWRSGSDLHVQCSDVQCLVSGSEPLELEWQVCWGPRHCSLWVFSRPGASKATPPPAKSFPLSYTRNRNKAVASFNSQKLMEPRDLSLSLWVRTPHRTYALNQRRSCSKWTAASSHPLSDCRCPGSTLNITLGDTRPSLLVQELDMSAAFDRLGFQSVGQQEHVLGHHPVHLR